MKFSLLFFLLCYQALNAISIEDSKEKQPVLAIEESHENDQNPLISLSRDFTNYFFKTLNGTLDFLNHTSTDLISNFKKSDRQNDSEETQADFPNHAHGILSLIPLPVFKQFEPEKADEKKVDMPFNLPLMFLNSIDDLIGKKKSLNGVIPSNEFENDDEITIVPEKVNVSVLEKENLTTPSDVNVDQNGFTAVSKFQEEFETTSPPINSTEDAIQEEEVEESTSKDPLKNTPIQLENFMAENFTITKNESIESLSLVVSYPPKNSVNKFYNLASDRLSEAAPNLKKVELDGGYVRVIGNESDPYSFSEELQFIKFNLEQIISSIHANNISIKSFDYNVWIFEDEDLLNQVDYATLIANTLQSIVHPHKFSPDFFEFQTEASCFDYSTVNLTIYIGKRINSSLIFAPEGQTPYYDTLLPSVEPFFAFLRSVQNSLNQIARSMQRWLKNGQPKSIVEKEVSEIDINKERSRIGKFVLSDQKLFNPSELPFMDLIQKSFGVDAVNEIDKHPICCEE